MSSSFAASATTAADFGRLVVGQVQDTPAGRKLLVHCSDDGPGDVVAMDAAELMSGLDQAARAPGP